MITIPIISNWNVCTPIVYRYIDSRFVDSFFKDGSIRLSSFARFSKHKDEQRLDPKEGKTYFVHRTYQNGGQTIEAIADHGANAYILCGTMKFEQGLQDSFQCDSYFRISNTTEFGAEIARSIPGFLAGFEGSCTYQTRRIVEQDLGYIDINQFRNPGETERVSQERLTRFVVERLSHLPYFLKEKEFVHQVEYRFVWLVRETVADYIDIKVPGALKYCHPPSRLSE